MTTEITTVTPLSFTLAGEPSVFSRMTSNVVESAIPLVDVGDEAHRLILTGDKSEDDAKADVENCPGRKVPGKLARFLGRRAICRGVITPETV